jgi:hypothetical protein
LGQKASRSASCESAGSTAVSRSLNFSGCGKNGLKKGKHALVKIARIAAELSASAWRFA